MNILLDTHVLLWWLADDACLGKKARGAIENVNNLTFVSAASIWEIMIKKALGKLDLPASFREVLAAESFQALDITWEHAFQVEFMPLLHRDPFDRMLIAQCQVEGLTLVTNDPAIRKYDVPILEA
jgi:PIN domain nuclease of toxin-antitoxin system